MVDKDRVNMKHTILLTDRERERDGQRSPLLTERGRTRILEAHVKVDLALLLLGSILTSFNAR